MFKKAFPVFLEANKVILAVFWCFDASAFEIFATEHFNQVSNIDDMMRKKMIDML